MPVKGVVLQFDHTAKDHIQQTIDCSWANLCLNIPPSEAEWYSPVKSMIESVGVFEDQNSGVSRSGNGVR